MRLAISHIAWDTGEDEQVADLLRRHQVDAIDIAPATYFPDPARVSDRDLLLVRQWWADRGFEITGMQALLFGSSGLNLFGPPEVKSAMLARLAAVCRIGAGVGASRFVFGSPKNRDRGDLDEEQAARTAIPFFRSLGDIAASHGVTICLEPNPPRYGANFMTTAASTAAVVRAVDHPSIRMHFDTGSLTINGEDPEALLQQHGDLMGHVQASEPDLVPLGDGPTDHIRIAGCLRRHLPHHVVAIEMLATKDEPHVVSIDRAVRKAVACYRTEEAAPT